jgi:hypothetical protein
MFTELRDSWGAHQKMPSIQLAAKHTILAELKTLQKTISLNREEVEQYLLRVVSCIPVQCPASFNMRRAANRVWNANLVPHVTLRDLARAALHSAELLRFNPFLSVEAEAQLHEWVLEDQLERMHSSALAAASASAAAASQELKRELEEIGREWEVHT